MNGRSWALLATGLLIAVIACAVLFGAGDIPIEGVLQVIAARIGLVSAADPLHDALVWTIRIPRVLLAVLVGASLAGAGALTQGLFRNNLADPSVLGVASGAALGAVFGFVLRLDAGGSWVTPVLAVVGALAVLAALFGLSLGRTDSTTLLLAGVALGTLCSAVTTFCLALVTDRHELGVKVIRWLMGSLEGRTWTHVVGALGPCTAGLGGALWLQRDLDALSLGEEIAASLGVDHYRLQRRVAVLVAVLVGTTTAVAGVIGFIGLIVPHITRHLLKSQVRGIVPMSALFGALFVATVDTGLRFSPIVIPPGVVTSLVGAPFFLWLLLRQSTERQA